MNKNIVLIGMPGSGKSTLGKIIAAKLKKAFIDMDDYIELKEKKTIGEMFNINEEYFRDMESKYSAIVGKLSSHIIATGGGIIKRKENIESLKKNSTIVFINRPVENIVRDINMKTRPLLKDGAEAVYRLYHERIHLYKEYSDIEVINEKELEEVANIIIKKVGEWYENNCN
ncbi:MAG: shikimate kinase [Tissierellia bacterium]|nr:shikimate kinase [Tissierellia bacterium]